MSRGNEGWDFLKVGKTYQYKEDSFIAEVTIIEDNSTEELYSFKVLVEKSNEKPYYEDGKFDVTHNKTISGYYSGMPQFYEEDEYYCDYLWINNNGSIQMKELNYRTPGVKGLRLKKVGEREDAAHPGTIENGFVIEGNFVEEPEKGKRFYVGSHFSTSEVQEILSDNKFKTYNSIYQWEVLDEPIEADANEQ